MAIFKSIENFGKMYRNMSCAMTNDISKEYVLYPKLHGTNASILINTDGTVLMRSKNRVLGEGSDNAGFWEAMDKKRKDISFHFHDSMEEVILFGEWCGQGIHSGAHDAICQLEDKTFIVFAIQFGDLIQTELESYHEKLKDLGMYYVTPIQYLTIPMDQSPSVTVVVDTINSIVEDMEDQDKWVEEHFGLEGVGEGIVGVPKGAMPVDEYFSFAFKAKTEAHRVKKTKDPAKMIEPLPHSLKEFVDMMVTPNRIRQAIDELDISYEIRNTPDVLKWVGNDVRKESVEELEELGLEWKQVAKYVNTRVVYIWKGMINEMDRSVYSGNTADCGT